jgi:uncharacterized phage protein gp47/JayE
MASPNTKTFTQLVQGQAAAVQAAFSGLIDFSLGSIELAFIEAVSGVVLWLQGLILLLLACTRAATSQGADLDTWMADYGLVRLPPGFASGLPTFTRFSTSGQAVVLVGANVQTTDGTQQFVVTPDPTNAAYNAALGGYVLPAGVATVNAPVLALTAGSAANVVAGSVTVISSAIPGIDTVSNPAAFSGGADGETDTAFRLRFVSFLGSLSKGTKAAIRAAVQGIQVGASCTVVENLSYAGATRLGYFYVIADDGTGTPSETFLTSAAAAVEGVRGLSIQYDVFAPVVVSADVGMVLSAAPGYVKATLAAAAQLALTTYTNALPGGGSLNYTKLAQIAYESSPGITNVSSVTLNGATGDLVATAKQVIKAGVIAPTAP